MISISWVEVPEYLRGGDLYRTLSTEEDDVFEVPANAFRRNLTIENNVDLSHALSSLRYWVVATPPVALIEYCLTLRAGVEECGLVLEEYSTELDYCKVLTRIVGYHRSSTTNMREALCGGCVQIVEYLSTSSEPAEGFQWSYDLFVAALEGDNVDCLAFAVSKGVPTYGYSVCARSMACLEYLLLHCSGYRPDFNSYATQADTKLVDHLLRNGFTWNDTTLRECAYHANLRMIQHLHERGCSGWRGVTSTAAAKGCLDILQYAHEHGAPWEAGTLLDAALNKQWVCLKYALEHGCPYRSHVARVVAKHSAPMLQYLRERDCPMGLDECMRSATLVGNLDVLRYLRRQGAAWPEDALSCLAQSYNVAALQFACEDGLSLDRPNAYGAAINPHNDTSLRCVRFLHEHGCPWDHTAVRAAIERGHNEALEYLLQHGCPTLPSNAQVAMDHMDHPVYLAANRGYAEALQILLLYGCRLDLSAAQLQALRYEQCRNLLADCAATDRGASSELPRDHYPAGVVADTDQNTTHTVDAADVMGRDGVAEDNGTGTVASTALVLFIP